MLKHLALAAMLASSPSVPTIARAQGTAPNAAVCDGSEMRHYDRARQIASALYLGAAAADLVAIVTIPRNPDGAGVASSHFAFVAATTPIALGGFVIARNAYPGDKFWQRVVASLKVGETRAADVQLCLHRPNVSSTSTTGQRWTYLITRPTAFSTTVGTLRLTFRDSVLADVERTEVRDYAAGKRRGSTDQPLDRHHGFCMPPMTVVADAFPTPTDTGFAAAAMARAKADADAAMKNAEASAAYAACIASDSAQ